MKRRDFIAGLALLPLASCGGMTPALAELPVVYGRIPVLWNSYSKKWKADWPRMRIGDFIYGKGLYLVIGKADGGRPIVRRAAEQELLKAWAR